MKIKTAVVIAGGLGTRLRPVTLTTPKALIPIHERTLIEHVIMKVLEAGVERVYVSIGYMADKIKAYLSNTMLDFDKVFIVEENPLGTGGWLNLLSDEQKSRDFSEDFIVVNGDNLFDLNWSNLLKVHHENDSVITIGLTSVDNVEDYGVVDLDGNKIKKFVEKPSRSDAPSNFINSGYYVFSPKVFDFVKFSGKFMLESDLFPRVAKEGLLHGYVDDAQWFDTGTKENWREAEENWRVFEKK